ncbi:hypothetical protein A9G45_13100 [Gilliamella sp. HK2]|jgi:hypothetical protein|uniref:hypothetical protein n=1 Tax=unclassified Gilliamella TaxID=2685620 RepID=UPI00080DBB28|nr:hypothetical protein [Gilliamella apicola]OCG15354.1 hypothetical protein A9G47_12335 [Gilliamella apicola]OCG31876.1 hypothetical protein A9G45_13100 [Gilliamella apicola]
MNTKEIQTKYGIIYTRNALILSEVKLECYPFTLVVDTSLSLAGCKPEILNVPEVKVTFMFNDIDRLSIYKIDEYPYEKYSKSSFDLVDEVHKAGKQRIILSTYDHIFDVIGRYEIKYY